MIGRAGVCVRVYRYIIGGRCTWIVFNCRHLTCQRGVHTVLCVNGAGESVYVGMTIQTLILELLSIIMIQPW